MQSSIGLDSVVARLPVGVTLGSTPLGVSGATLGSRQRRATLARPEVGSARSPAISPAFPRHDDGSRVKVRSPMNTTATTASGHHVGCDCGTCAVTHFERNNYFTGKLLLERDFTDEQDYVLAKLRHHNQRLHGSGVVCGLRLVQHPNRDCRTRFVRLTPGTAVDCCGNDVWSPPRRTSSWLRCAAVAAHRPERRDAARDRDLRALPRVRQRAGPRALRRVRLRRRPVPAQPDPGVLPGRRGAGPACLDGVDRARR